jgi:DNA polymerase III delta prime subunit
LSSRVSGDQSSNRSGSLRTSDSSADNENLAESDNGSNSKYTRELPSQKRRKISGTPVLDLGCGEDNENWRVQLEIAAGMATEQDLSAKPAGNSPEVEHKRHETIPGKTSHVKNVDGNVAVADGAAPSSYEEKNDRQATSHRITVPPTTPRSTPKRKLLKLNKNGKLLSSPPLDKKPERKGNQGQKDQLRAKVSHRSWKVVLRYGSDTDTRLHIGNQIDDILNDPGQSGARGSPARKNEHKSTHPFFLGPAARMPEPLTDLRSTSSSIKGQESENEGSNRPLMVKPVAWKDLVFASDRQRHQKSISTDPAPWPPVELHHLGRDKVSEFPATEKTKYWQGAGSKRKQCPTYVPSSEDILQIYAKSLSSGADSKDRGVRIPERAVMTGSEMIELRDSSKFQSSRPTVHPAIFALRSRLQASATAFDQGKTDDGSAWISRYAPECTTSILQPNAVKLRDWLQASMSLNTQTAHASDSRALGALSALPTRKKKRRKISDDLDGFVISSEDETTDAIHSEALGAIILCGPSGCGKTASVYAIARELGIEVFEVHPGMRRSAKDIFDKVGDMTRNHLVHMGEDSDIAQSDSPSIADDRDTRNEINAGRQQTMATFLAKNTETEARNKRKKQKSANKHDSRASDEAPTRPKSQKKSLILFEEVDLLFEDDRGFWSGIATLIEQSKRPVILTCNDESTIPFADLPSLQIIRYDAPTPDIAAEYITLLALNEGHKLTVELVKGLYISNGNDLRSTIVDIDFWCQMAIGSRKGGLDWMIDQQVISSSMRENSGPPRVFSLDTYMPGIGLLAFEAPEAEAAFWSEEPLLSYAEDYLGIRLTEWHESTAALQAAYHGTSFQNRVQHNEALVKAESASESRSDLDLFNGIAECAMSAAIHRTTTRSQAALTATDLLEFQQQRSTPEYLSGEKLMFAFDPLMDEKPTFPPAQGRLAPSFEFSTSIITVDLAPYIRSIVAFDERLEMQRDALVGTLQGKKARTTRAARAAIEGGSKANTRRERWFPADTDFTRVLNTGGKEWPLWMPDASRMNDRHGPTPSQETIEERG